MCRYDGDVTRQRLADDVRSSFHQRRQHKKPCTGEQTNGLPSRFLPCPRVSGIAPFLTLRSTLIRRSQRAPDVKQVKSGGFGKQPNRGGGEERIFDVAYVADDADFPYSSPRRERSGRSGEGLVDDA